jgi:hypothetical protein
MNPSCCKSLLDQGFLLPIASNIEDNVRSDCAEGFPSIAVSGKGDGQIRSLSAIEVNRLSEVTGSGIRINKADLKINIKGSGKLIFENEINMFVFCTSIKNDLEKFGGRKIEIIDPNLFSKRIANELLAEITTHETIKLKGKFDSISHCHKRVEYLNKVTSLDYHIEKSDYSMKMKNIFEKPLQYSAEEEYRFVWFPYSNLEKSACNLPFGFKFIDIHLSDIMRYIKVY